MKNKIAAILVVVLVFSCHNNHTRPQNELKDTLTIAIRQEATPVSKDAHYFWTASIGAKGIELQKDRVAQKDSLVTARVIAMMNRAYPAIPLQWVKQSGDTLFVHIAPSNYLTRQMGTSGAEAYIAEATYNLTEVEGIAYVHFDFKEGDHAQPGTFSRTDFVQYQ